MSRHAFTQWVGLATLLSASGVAEAQAVGSPPIFVPQVESGAPTGGSLADIVQIGTGHVLKLVQSGSVTAAVQQHGTDNSARLDQQGQALIAIQQNGDGNGVTGIQDGQLNSAVLSQSGQSNLMSFEQRGTDNTLVWEQIGDGLTSPTVVMSGSSTIRLQQLGW